MLLALLLSVLPTAVPVVIYQDPAPAAEPFMQWDGETEDAYRRALHLWAVRGKPGEAADILLQLADSAEVTQVAGQASWVLVLAAQALVEAGRRDEASALIPGIERGARGTELAAVVNLNLAKLGGQLGVGANGLDPAFKEYLRETLDKPTATAWVSDKYGRALLPYIVDLLESWRFDPKESSVVIKAIDLGWAIADDPYVNQLIQLTEEMSTLTYLTAFGSGRAAGDLTAKRASLRFWLTQARSTNEHRAASANAMLPAFLLNIDEQSDAEILEHAINSGPVLLSGIINELTGHRKETARQLLLTIAREAPPEQARLAGNALSRFGVQEVADLAASGQLVDVARYLAVISRMRLDNWSLPSSNLTVEDVVTRLAEDCQVGVFSVSEQVTRQGTRNWQAPLVSGWKNALDVPEALLENESLRSLLALAAVGIGDAVALDRALAPGPSLYSEVLLMLIGNYGGPLCPSIWRDLETYYRLAPTSSLERTWRANSQEINLEQARKINRVYPEFNEWGIIFGSWSNLNLANDLRSVLRDSTFTWRARQAAAIPYGESDVTPDSELLTSMIQGWRSLPKPDQQQLISAIRAVFYKAPEVIRPQDQPELLELFYSNNVQCFLVEHALKRDTPAKWEPVLAFITNRERALWIAPQIHGVTRSASAPTLAVTLVRAGLLEQSLLPLDPESMEWVRAGSAEALEITRIFLNSIDVNHRIIALNFLMKDSAAFLALQKELVLSWQNPELASWVAMTAAKHSRELDPVDRLLEAWQLPGLRNRSMVLRAMINTTNPRFVPVLLSAISDAEENVAATAREGLLRLKELEEQRAFWESWQATGVGGSPTAALLKQIQSKNKEVRLSAIRALGAVKAPEALPLLISLLEDPDPEVVKAARAGLAWLNPEAAPK